MATNNCSPGIVDTPVKAFVRACAGSFFRNPQMHLHFNYLHAKASFGCGLFLRAVAHDILAKGTNHTSNMRDTPSPPTKSSGFGGFDSSKLFILKGGNSHVR